MVRLVTTQTTIVQFVIGLICILLLDACWFHFAGRAVYQHTGAIDPATLKPQFGILAWCALAAAVAMLDVQASDKDAIGYGAFVGLVSYSVFNGTYLSISPQWRRTWWVPVSDIAWGATNLALTTFVTVKASKRLV